MRPASIGLVASGFPILVGIALGQVPVEHNRVPPEVVKLLGLGPDDGINVLSDGTVTNLRARSLDLNSDGVSEIVVSGMGEVCGAANCPTWVFGVDAKRYRLLLDAGSAQSLEPLETKANGYFDVEVRQHGSATESALAIFRYDGGQYRAAECMHVSYSELDTQGKERYLEKPRITPAVC